MNTNKQIMDDIATYIEMGLNDDFITLWKNMTDYHLNVLTKLWKDVPNVQKYGFLNGFLKCLDAGQESIVELPSSIKNDMYLIKNINFNTVRNYFELKNLIEIIAMRRSLNKPKKINGERKLINLSNIPELWDTLSEQEQSMYVDTLDQFRGLVKFIT